MASVVSSKQLESLNERLKSTRERVKGDRKEAIRVLQAAGITNKKGKLTSIYRVIEDK